MLYDIMDVMENMDKIDIHDQLMINTIIWYTNYNVENVISDEWGIPVIQIPLDE